MRDRLRQIFTSLFPTAGPIDVENGVVRGKDGWLFLWEGSNEVHRYYTDADYFTETDVVAWKALIAERNAKLAEMDVTYRHVVVPDKISVYPEYVPTKLSYFGKHPTARFAKAFSGNPVYVDLLDLLNISGQKDSFFFKTDSHWTSAGGYEAYKALCKSLNVMARPLEGRSGKKGKELAMDLGGKLSPPVTEHAHFAGRMMQDSKRVHENAVVRYNETEGMKTGKARFGGSMVHNHNPSPEAEQKTLVIFGDSFSEFRPHLLTGMFSETFRDVYFVWWVELDYDFIREVKADIVLTEIAERFCKRLPVDNFRVEVD